MPTFCYRVRILPVTMTASIEGGIFFRSKIRLDSPHFMTIGVFSYLKYSGRNLLRRLYPISVFSMHA